MHALVVMHRRTLFENVDSAKIKVCFYTTDIDILSVALMHRIVIHCIDISMNRYTPTDDTWTIFPMLLLCVCVLIVVIHLLSTQGQRIKNILNCVLKMNEGLTGLEQHQGEELMTIFIFGSTIPLIN